MMPSSLGGRLFFVAAVLIVLALVGAGSATGLFLYRFVQVQIDQRLDAQIGAIASALSVASGNRLSLDNHVDTPPPPLPPSRFHATSDESRFPFASSVTDVPPTAVTNGSEDA